MVLIVRAYKFLVPCIKSPIPGAHSTYITFEKIWESLKLFGDMLRLMISRLLYTLNSTGFKTFYFNI